MDTCMHVIHIKIDTLTVTLCTGGMCAIEIADEERITYTHTRLNDESNINIAVSFEMEKPLNEEN